MADCAKHEARLQLFTETVLHGIFRGQLAFGAYKEVHVYNIFKLTSIGKTSSNYSSRRFTLPLQSLMYFVEDVANYSMSNATFVTILRTEENTFLSVGVTDTCGSLSSLSSAKSANDMYNEPIVADGWFAVFIIITFVAVLYLSTVFTFFRPSEIKVKVPRRTPEVQEGRLHLPKNVHPTDPYCGYIEREIREGHATPSETDDAMIPSPSNSTSASTRNRMNDSEQVRSTSKSIRNIEEPSDTNSLNDAKQGSISAQSDRNIKDPCDANSLKDHKRVSTSHSDRNIEDPSADNNLNDAEQASTSPSDRNIEDPSAANSLNDDEQASISQSDRNTEEPSAANGLNETRVDIDQSSEEQGEEETEHALAIIVGETYPVGFGSFIGNKLFSTTHERNTAWNIVKLIFMFSALPLLFFLGFGDLFLFLLPKLHSRLSDHFPFTFLTRSLGYGFLTSHPILLIPIVFSALAHLIRLFSACFPHSSSTLVTEWQSCCVHLMHPKCFAFKLAQYFFSDCLPSALKPCEKCCNPAPSECFKCLDLPQNISHNLEKLPDIFIKCWECCSDFWKRENICNPKGILSLLALVLMSIIFIIIAIFCMSPLVCLSHGRLRLFDSRVIDSVIMVFSLAWVTIFFFALSLWGSLQQGLLRY